MARVPGGLALLLAFAAYAAAQTQSGTPLTLTGLAPQNCTSAYNRAKYAADSQIIASGKPVFPTTCPLPSQSCNCTSAFYVVAPWRVLTLPNPTDNYPVAADGNKTFPYYAGAFSRTGCCRQCKGNNKVRLANGTISSFYADGTAVPIKCAYWLHYVSPNALTCSNATASDQCGYCYIYPPGAPPPTCNNQVTCANTSERWPASHIATVGMGCPGCANDPHFIGAKGTHFDFNGVPDQSFCLITDQKYQINIRMRGYYDHRTVGASVLRNGMAVRTWIKDLGIVWIDPDTGARHAFKMWARDGKSTTRDAGYLGGMELDGAPLARLAVTDRAEFEGGLRVAFEGYEKSGGGFFDVDVYQIVVKGLLDVEVKLRVAHPLLQTADDAMTHINVRFESVQHTTDIHGVLGQTFRDGREVRAMEYSALARLIGRDIAADGESGAGFLDGDTVDYRTSDVTATDCKYSAFGGRELPL